ncbi:glutathione S-transferase T1-like isoform X1 [Apium graveolens]|uniref:glutathione S-transferase T1-like isoform X1 n=1 Tax=Apium graveolens TaxID=4045 RepID=UPI003D7BA688
MKLQIYSNRLSQPCRAIIIFCKLHGIEFEEINISVAKGQQFTPEYKVINPMGKLPAIVHGSYKLFESHAILIYLACSFPGVADHWYPSDIQKKAKIHSVLDWHHSNLRQGEVGYVQNRTLKPLLGGKLDPEATAVNEKLLSKSLAKIENFWLKGDGKFLLGNFQPSIADLSLVCEIMQLQLVPESDRYRILSTYKKVLQWIEDTRNATNPYFDELHSFILELKVVLTVDGSVVVNEVTKQSHAALSKL